MSAIDRQFPDSDVRRVERDMIVSLVTAFLCFPLGLWFAFGALNRLTEMLDNVRDRDLPPSAVVRLSAARAMGIMAIVFSVLTPVSLLALILLERPR